MAEMQNTPRSEIQGVLHYTEDAVDSTAGWCICARSGDMWHCQDRPRFDSDSQGRCCALGGIATLAGTDTWDGVSAQALRENPCEADRG